MTGTLSWHTTLKGLVAACCSYWFCVSMACYCQDQMKALRYLQVMYYAHRRQIRPSHCPCLRLMFCLQPKWAGKPRCKWLEVRWCCSALRSTSDLVPRIPSQQIAAGERHKVQKGIGNLSDATLAWELDIQCFTSVFATLICPEVNVNWSLHFSVQIGIQLFVLPNV